VLLNDRVTGTSEMWDIGELETAIKGKGDGECVPINGKKDGC